MAAPSKYKPEFIEQARKLAELGHIDAEIASFFGIHVRVFNTWKGKHPEMAAALKVGKHEADERVTRALFQRAVGYVAPDTMVVRAKNGRPRIMKTVKHFPPDPTSCIFWLKNRRPEEWREKFEHDHGLTASREKLQELLRAVEERIGDPQISPEGIAPGPRRPQ